jgi:hypothetical protein
VIEESFLQIQIGSFDTSIVDALLIIGYYSTGFDEAVIDVIAKANDAPTPINYSNCF